MSTSKRVNVSLTTHTNSAITASKRFAKKLFLRGYDWAAEEVLEMVENGFLCSSNASGHNLQEGIVNFPSTGDWSYFWAIKQDEDTFYAWFIERNQL